MLHSQSDTVRGDNGPGRIDELSGSIGEHAVDSGGDMGDSEHLIPCDRRLAPSEVAKHDSRDDCWIIVNGRVLDVTGFLGDHPGGEKSILNFAGRDASRMFNMIHSPDVIEKFLPEDKILGPVAEEEPAGSKVDEVDVHSEEDHEKREDTFVVPRCCRNSESDTTTSVHHVDESEGGSAVDREDAGEAHTEPAEYWLVLGGQVHDMTSVLPDLLDGTDESILAFGGMHLAEGACPSNSDTAVQLGDGSTVSPVDFLPVESESEEPVPQAGRRYIPMTEVAKHCSEDDCWIVINGEVLDVTSFLSEHPGGKKPILSVAGGDASEKYNLVHPKEFVEKYVPNLVLGDLSHDGQEVARSSPEEALSLGFSEVAQRYLVSFYYLVLLFVKEALRSIFTVENFKVLSDRSGLTRSAIFLMAFVTIHALGNIHLFFGAEHFNGYAHFLNHPVPVIDTLARPIEIYLLLAGLMHVIVAVDRTFKFKKERLSLKDMEMGVTGAILLVFLLVHLLQFRLAPDAVFAPFDFRSRWLPPFHCSPDNASCEMVRVRDLYKGVFDLFKSPFWVLFYAIGTAACFHHMREGLHRIVRSSEDVPYKYNLTVQTWGSVMAWVVGILFLSFPLYAYLNNENRLV
ncbi:hypothetical protein FOZ61_001613 [Perkinsus olseni]|uniref:Cytochrome b5 heme-binding domain-containing protein n=1 Tax=Perkinsus olseni TaxID=32597 RepID=A0A7J6LW30_PEROL|nr:hypothetical protein FOZ61_001613 [Perkinsus olseni]